MNTPCLLLVLVEVSIHLPLSLGPSLIDSPQLVSPTGLVTSSMIVSTSGVAFPVPRNKVTMGKATVFANSPEKENIFIKIFNGSSPKTINQRIRCSIVANLLISF
jgi:hypothetical protein